MAPVDNPLASRRNVIALAVLILVVALAARFVNIGWSFSNNGIDEGIMLERALLVGRGYDLYTEVPCDQAPLAFLVGAWFDGEVIPLRSLSAALSILAILACMYSARRLQGDAAMLITGALLALDFAFLRESRLFSLDGLSAYFLAFSLLALLVYAKDKSRLALAAAGLLIGVATAIKLFGGLAFVGAVVFMILEARRDHARRSVLAADLSIVSIAAVAPMAVLMLALGPSDMIQGMVLDQGGREFDAFLKLSIVAFFGVNPAYVLPLVRARIMWGRNPGLRVLLAMSFVILAGMILQPLTFLHHMVFLSPGLAVLAGVATSDLIGHRKGSITPSTSSASSKSEIVIARAVAAVFLVSLMIGGGFASFGISKQPEPPSNHFVSYVRSYSDPDEYIVTGDPLIAALAGRMVPPELVNMAYRTADPVTEEDIEAAVLAYDVRVVIVCYRMQDMPGLVAFLEDNGFRELAGLYQPDPAGVLDLFQEGDLTFTLYVRD